MAITNFDILFIYYLFIQPVYNIERDVSRWTKWMNVAITSSGIHKKSVNRGLIVTDIGLFRFAAAVMKKNMFHLLLFLFDAKCCELWTKEVRKLQADVKHV